MPSLAPLLKVPTRVVDAKETGEADATIICPVLIPIILEVNAPFKVVIKSPIAGVPLSAASDNVITVEPTPTVAELINLNFSKEVAVPTLLNTWKNVLLPAVGSGNRVSGLEEYSTSGKHSCHC